MSVHVTVKVDPKVCGMTTRNGHPPIAEFEIRLWADNRHVSIVGMSRRGKKLNGGFVLTADAMDQAAVAWLAQRFPNHEKTLRDMFTEGA